MDELPRRISDTQRPAARSICLRGCAGCRRSGSSRSPVRIQTQKCPSEERSPIECATSVLPSQAAYQQPCPTANRNSRASSRISCNLSRRACHNVVCDCELPLVTPVSCRCILSRGEKDGFLPRPWLREQGNSFALIAASRTCHCRGRYRCIGTTAHSQSGFQITSNESGGVNA